MQERKPWLFRNRMLEQELRNRKLVLLELRIRTMVLVLRMLVLELRSKVLELVRSRMGHRCT